MEKEKKVITVQIDEEFYDSLMAGGGGSSEPKVIYDMEKNEDKLALWNLLQSLPKNDNNKVENLPITVVTNTPSSFPEESTCWILDAFVEGEQSFTFALISWKDSSTTDRTYIGWGQLDNYEGNLEFYFPS